MSVITLLSLSIDTSRCVANQTKVRRVIAFYQQTVSLIPSAVVGVGYGMQTVSGYHAMTQLKAFRKDSVSCYGTIRTSPFDPEIIIFLRG